MICKFAFVALFASFFAVASSGMLMFLIEIPSFTVQMNPTHKTFGPSVLGILALLIGS